MIVGVTDIYFVYNNVLPPSNEMVNAYGEPTKSFPYEVA